MKPHVKPIAVKKPHKLEGTGFSTQEANCLAMPIVSRQKIFVKILTVMADQQEFSAMELAASQIKFA